MAGALAWVKQNRRSPKVIVPVVLLILYVLGTLFFSTRYLPGTTINGEDVSWKTPSDVAALMQDKAKDYQLQVEGDGVELSLAGTRMNLSYDNDAFVAGAEARIPSWKWVAALLQDRSYNVSNGIAFNEGRVSRAVYAAVTEANKGTVVPKNATLDYDDKAASFVVVDEQPGTAVNEEATFERTSGALKTLRTRVKLTEADLEQPTLLANDSRMAQAIEQANKLDGLSFDLTVDGNVVKSLDPSLVRSWVSLDTSCQVTGDLDMVTQWAVGSLSSEFDSVGSTRTYTRPDDGKYIEVSGGTYGWNVDGAELAQLICEQIAAGSSDPIEIPFKSRAAVFSPGGADWGTRYLDVDLSEQYVRFFDEYGNLVWESECVSGDVGLGNDTVTGVFILYSKESPKKLIGLDYDGDGEPDYENDVTFWMPFYGGYGLHDAEWRSYFGPDAYTYYGSHGCINLPYDAAEQLFYTIEIDDPVVVHY